MADPFLENDAPHGGAIDRAAFLDQYRYKLLGIVFEATTIKFLMADGGASYEKRREELMRDCDKLLALIYDDMGKCK